MDNKSSLRIDLRLVCVVLLLIIVGMLAFWRPWEDSDTKRTISVTGDAVIEAVPDEFVFSSTIKKTGSDPQKLKDELAKVGEKLVADLKGLGVEENKIKLSGSSYDSYDYYYYRNDKGEETGQLQITITVGTKELAQKVQDYLLTQDIEGQLTPQAQFSVSKQDELKNQARDKAVADAKSEAERTAQGAGARLGKVVEIKDSESIAYPWFASPGIALDAAERDKASLPVTPGENTFTFQIHATFELK